MIVTITNISNQIISGPLGVMSPGQTISDNLFPSRRLELIGKDLLALAAQGYVRYSVTDDGSVPDLAEYETRGELANRFFDSGVVTSTGSNQFFPHGFGKLPSFVMWSMLDTSPAVAAQWTMVEGWSAGITADGSGLLGGTTAGTGTAALGKLALASATSGNFTVSVNGTAVTTAFTTDNNTTAAAVATALTNAFPHIFASVSASSGTITLTALKQGTPGNTITLQAVAGTGTWALNGGTAAASVAGNMGAGTGGATTGADSVNAQGTITINPTILPPPSALLGFAIGSLPQIGVPWQGSNNATATALGAAANANYLFTQAGYVATVATNTVVITKTGGGQYSNLIPFAPWGSHDNVNLVMKFSPTGKQYRVLAFA